MPEPVLTLLATPSAFASLGLSPKILEALEAAQYTTPTPIQKQAIPLALSGRDIIGCAATGTGKTAAFLLPILDRLAGKRGTRALILAPTRELVMQIVEHAARFGDAHDLRVATIIGGASMRVQVAELRQQRELIVATPGRLMDHLEQRTARLDGIEVLVLDEADRMLDMGFRPQLERILKFVPKQRQTMLFSATVDGEVGSFAKRCLVDPAQVEIERAGTIAKNATQTAYVVDESDKPALLLSLVSQLDESTLVFTRTQHRADKVAKLLTKVGVPAGRIHGGRTQGQRSAALDGFKERRFRVLVATDIAARGIDVAGIGHVVIYDMARVAEDHVHRVGRTARNEAVGHASTFVSHQESKGLRDIEKYTGTRIVRGEIPADLPARRAEIEAAKNAPSERGERSERSERPERGFRGGDRSYGDRPRGERGSRPDRSARPDRGFGPKRGFEARGDRRPSNDGPPKRRGFEVHRSFDDAPRARNDDAPRPRNDRAHDASERPQRVEVERARPPREERQDTPTSERSESPRKTHGSDRVVKPREPRAVEHDAPPQERPRTDRAEKPFDGPPTDRRHARRDDRPRDDRPRAHSDDRRDERSDRPQSRSHPPVREGVREWRSTHAKKNLEDTRASFEKKSASDRGGFEKKRGFGSRGGFGGKPAFGNKSGFGNKPAFGAKSGFEKREGFSGKPRFEKKGGFGKPAASGDRDARGGFGKRDDAGRRSHGASSAAFGARKSRFGDRPTGSGRDNPREGGKPGFASKDRYRPKNRFRGERS